MIRCSVNSRQGVLSRLESTGHGSIDNTEARVSISCAAVSTLIRTVGTLLEKSESVHIALERFQPGDVALTVEYVDESAEEWLRGLTDMLSQGLEDLQREYPEQIVFSRSFNE